MKGRENILKRLLIHVGAFNLSLAMRSKLGAGTPRGLADVRKRAKATVEGLKLGLARLCATLAVVFGRLRIQGRLSIVAPPLPPLAPAA